MNKNIIVLIVLAVVLFALIYFYAWPQWKKYHPTIPEAQPMQPGEMPVPGPN